MRVQPNRHIVIDVDIDP
ncbi:Protein of unknown function [Lactobacillus helveticus CIRM-BIA 104]|uniref:Uncharacterized protein n=1 Tax=Lactobacillus helveticus CIRM-BIA 104 TaxID=1226333 RepID=U6FEN4_LACHE|nr:Protein of unknown function [Lactobacillus helveticus CIRM-BIA 104]